MNGTHLIFCSLCNGCGYKNKTTQVALMRVYASNQPPQAFPSLSNRCENFIEQKTHTRLKDFNAILVTHHQIYPRTFSSLPGNPVRSGLFALNCKKRETSRFRFFLQIKILHQRYGE